MSPKATRARELNHAISQLWQAEACHSKADFEAHIVPIYTTLHEQLKHHQPDTADKTLEDLLNRTTAACHYRWSTRLPLKRPGTDYRRYEIIYTYALITAMAVHCLKNHKKDATPEALATTLLPPLGLTNLKADPMVWVDWLGYFEQAEVGGLYAIATQTRTQPRPIIKRYSAPPNKPPPGSGRAMLEAIKAALNDGTLSYNQPTDAVQVDGAGRTFLEHPKILKWCSEQLQLEEDLKTLKGRFSRLKVHKRSKEGKQLFYGRRSKQDRKRIGYVVENPNILWSGEAPPGLFEIEHLNR